MDRANQALRRGSIRIRSLASGHGDLNMIISDLKELKAACKKMSSVQKMTWDDMCAWSSKESNQAFHDTFRHLSELNNLWCEVQREFVASIKTLQGQFNMMLESEISLDKSTAHLIAQQVLEKIETSRMEGRRKKGLPCQDVEEKLQKVRAEINAAQCQVSNRTLQNETLKLTTVKDSLRLFSEAYLQKAHKTGIIYSAHKLVVHNLPDVYSNDIHNLRCIDPKIPRDIVAKAKADVLCYSEPEISAPPPPYSFSPPVQMPFNRSLESNESNLSLRSDSDSSSSRLHRYDLPPRENYENIGAYGFMN